MTILLILLFVLMIAAPCVLALRSSRKIDDNVQAEEEGPELEAAMEPEPAPVCPPTPLPLRERSELAEAEARIAREIARMAYWAALAADARAAALRADLAAEVAAVDARRAQKAKRAAEVKLVAGYLPEDHPSLNFPRSRAKRRAA